MKFDCSMITSANTYTITFACGNTIQITLSNSMLRVVRAVEQWAGLLSRSSFGRSIAFAIAIVQHLHLKIIAELTGSEN